MMRMRQIFTLLVLAATLLSCSTDDTGIINTNDTEAAYIITTNNVSEETISERADRYSTCFNEVQGRISLDLSSGLNNPILEFGTYIPAAPVSTQIGYTVQLYLQPIQDCEDMNSDIGTATVFTLPYSVVNLQNIPDFRISPSQLPSQCYKWKVVVQTPRGYAPYCGSSSIWHDAPLY